MNKYCLRVNMQVHLATLTVGGKGRGGRRPERKVEPLSNMKNVTGEKTERENPQGLNIQCTLTRHGGGDTI